MCHIEMYKGTIASKIQEVEIKRIALKFVKFVILKCLIHGIAQKNQEDEIEYFEMYQM